jgi:hypothetical protein
MIKQWKIVTMAAIAMGICAGAMAQGTNSSTTTSTNAVRRTQSEHQAAVASTNASYGSITATDDAYKSALDAHALDDALKMVDKDGAFKGKVAKVYEPHGLAIVEFDENYRTALTAIVRGTNFSKFPALTNLIGKDVVVTGKFIKYRDAAEIVLDKPEQIKVVK